MPLEVAAGVFVHPPLGGGWGCPVWGTGLLCGSLVIDLSWGGVDDADAGVLIGLRLVDQCLGPLSPGSTALPWAD